MDFGCDPTPGDKRRTFDDFFIRLHEVFARGIGTVHVAKRERPDEFH
jgi:hypothetical protein